MLVQIVGWVEDQQVNETARQEVHPDQTIAADGPLGGAPRRSGGSSLSRRSDSLPISEASALSVLFRGHASFARFSHQVWLRRVFKAYARDSSSSSSLARRRLHLRGEHLDELTHRLARPGRLRRACAPRPRRSPLPGRRRPAGRGPSAFRCRGSSPACARRGRLPRPGRRRPSAGRQRSARSR